jgi:hypothetical protein
MSLSFDGVLVSSNGYSVTVQLTSKQPGMSFHVAIIYGPAASTKKANFISWLYNFDTSVIEDWLISGDFNLLRSLSDRSRPRGDINEMILFNELIHRLDLVEISFQGRNFTWSNMQNDPLLQKLE